MTTFSALIRQKKQPFGNVGIDISASALVSGLASVSPFEYKYSFFAQYKYPLELKASSIYFVKHVISNKLATYRLEACDYVRKCFVKISRRKFPDNL